MKPTTMTIGKILLMSSIVINVPTRTSLAVETKGLLFLWLAHWITKAVNVKKYLPYMKKKLEIELSLISKSFYLLKSICKSVSKLVCKWEIKCKAMTAANIPCRDPFFSRLKLDEPENLSKHHWNRIVLRIYPFPMHVQSRCCALWDSSLCSLLKVVSNVPSGLWQSCNYRTVW